VLVDLVLGGWATPAPEQALAANLDIIADRVFGLPGFHSSIGNNDGPSAQSPAGLTGVTLDTSGLLYVAEWYNRRVLEYD
jgi:hypothetical protein